MQIWAVLEPQFQPLSWYSPINFVVPISKKARGPMQQMRLCGNSVDPSALARMDVAIADFIHSHLLPFSISSDAKLLQIVEIAKQLGLYFLVQCFLLHSILVLTHKTYLTHISSRQTGTWWVAPLTISMTPTGRLKWIPSCLKPGYLVWPCLGMVQLSRLVLLLTF